MSAQERAGRPVCQVKGCQEWAPPLGSVFTILDLDLRLILCPRHERELVGLMEELAR